MPTRSPYDLLLDKLEEFRRRYYLNQLIRGALLATAFLLVAYLVLSLLEYRFYFPPAVRAVLLYGGLAAAGLALMAWVLQPALRYWRVGSRMSDDEAARLIGAHFPGVSDRLLNILQLQRQENGSEVNALIEASVNQKIGGLESVPFRGAVDLRANQRYLPWVAPPLLAFLFVLIAAPSILEESNARLIRPGQRFEREAPFRFAFDAQNLETEQFQDFTVELGLEGDALPESVQVILADGARYRMQRLAPDRYAYTFRQPAEDQGFYFEAAGFTSESHTLRVLPTPSLQQLSLRLDYPAYTGRKDEVLRNTGDATVPVGTEITWTIQTQHSASVGLQFADSLYQAERRGENEFHWTKVMLEDAAYRVGVANDRLAGRDSLAYRIGVVPDQFPRIRAEELVDSTNRKFLFFLGEASDDYGLRNLNFIWRWERLDAGGNRVPVADETIPLALDRSQARSAFNHGWNVAELDLEPGDRLTYYFQIWDNDAIHGAKSARTAAMTYEMPTRAAFEQQETVRNEAIKDKLASTLEEIDKAQEEMDRLREKLVQQKELDWADRQSLEALMQQQEQIRKNVEELREDYRENLKEQSDFKKYDDRLAQKQQQLQQMFEEVVPDELKQMMDELEQLLEQLGKEQGLDELEDMQLTDEQLENELDRMLELFKQMELEQQLQDAIDQLEELAEQQEQLAEESKEPDSDPADMAERQEKLNEAFEDVREDLDRLDELNEALEDPNELPDTESQEESLEQSMEESLEQLSESEQSQQDGKENKSQQQQQQASEQQEQSAQEMKELAESLQSAASAMQQQQQSEDLQALRQLLDNLIKLSFDQESLMDELATVPTGNPRYVELVQEQFRLREDAEMVEDSLLALASRVFEISTFVTRELADMNRHMDKGIEQLAERRVGEGRVEQQYVMTGLNNLALMLNEVMDQMMEQMANQMPGNQMCQKPGSGKPGSQGKPQMGKMQDALNKQLQQLKDGQQPGQRNPLGAKQFAQMAARQAAIRQALDQMAQQMQGGGEDGELAREMKEIADQMEKTEEDLVNKVFENGTLMRQQQILTRLLEAEEAMREREISPKRESNTAQEISPAIPPSLEEYLKKRQSEIDLFKTVPADLKPYYRQLVEEYLNNLEF